jgi:hypothetical protein
MRILDYNDYKGNIDGVANITVDNFLKKDNKMRCFLKIDNTDKLQKFINNEIKLNIALGDNNGIGILLPKCNYSGLQITLKNMGVYEIAMMDF